MKLDDTATLTRSVPLLQQRSGIGWGLFAVTLFSLTIPFTRFVVADGAMSPIFVGMGRCVLAGAAAALVLLIARPRRPQGRQWVQVAVVAAGNIGFPLFTSLALAHTPANHGAVVIALLPAATAVIAVLRTGERTAPRFWIAAGSGALAAIVFAMLSSGGGFSLQMADLLLLAGVLTCAMGYAEGGLLSRTLGSWQTVSWGLILSLPVTLPSTIIAAVAHPPVATGIQWVAFAYLGLISAYGGLFIWYGALARGPMATVSQVQLIQPVITIGWAVVLLHEPVGLLTIAGGAVVIGSALLAVRARQHPAPTVKG